MISTKKAVKKVVSRKSASKSKKKWSHSGCKIALMAAIVILAVLCLYAYLNMKADTRRLDDAMMTFSAGNLEHGLVKCGAVERQRERAFCYSFYLGLKMNLIKTQAMSENNGILTEAQQQEMESQLQKEYGLVCGIDRSNPYMTKLCGAMI